MAVVRYGGGIIDWNIDELRQMDRKTRKMITMYGAFHPKSDIDRLYLPRNRGGCGLIVCEVVLGDSTTITITIDSYKTITIVNTIAIFTQVLHLKSIVIIIKKE